MRKPKRGTRRERLPLDEVPELAEAEASLNARECSLARSVCASVGGGGPRSAAHAAPFALLAVTFAAGMYATLDGSWSESPLPPLEGPPTRRRL